jgi:hypothetical protein
MPAPVPAETRLRRRPRRAAIPHSFGLQGAGSRSIRLPSSAPRPPTRCRAQVACGFSRHRVRHVASARVVRRAVRRRPQPARGTLTCHWWRAIGSATRAATPVIEADDILHRGSARRGTARQHRVLRGVTDTATRQPLRMIACVRTAGASRVAGRPRRRPCASSCPSRREATHRNAAARPFSRPTVRICQRLSCNVRTMSRIEWGRLSIRHKARRTG